MINSLVRAIKWVGRFLVNTGMSILLIIGFTILPAALVTGFGLTAMQYWVNLPEEIKVPDTLPQHSQMLAADGTVIANFYGENRIPLTLAEIPDRVEQAVIATEDARFYQHNGVDWQGTARALYNNIRGGSRQGGSGITQQYVKTLLIMNAETNTEADAAREISIQRKIQEAKYALKLEEQIPKEKILELYLNTVYFGDGAYGIGAAAKHYFNKPADKLSLGEIAILVGAVNNPTKYNPALDMRAALERRDHVLNRMQDEKYITAEEAARAKQENIVLDLHTPANGCVVSPYPGYCQWVREILNNDPTFGETPEQRQEFLFKGGLIIRTALDPKVQKAAEKAAQRALPAKGRVATALAVVEPGTGKVLALASNKPFGQKKGETEIVLAARPAFQNGSTFKPLTAAAALEMGVDPNIIISAGETYTPTTRNYPEGGFHNAGDGKGGTYTMAQALEHSTNTWFVELEDRIGVKTVARVAYAMGLTSLPLTGEKAITEKDAALTLGAWDTSPLQVANSFATLAAHGMSCNPIGITSILDSNNTSVQVPKADCRQVIKASTADTVTSMLVGVIDSPGGTGFRADLGDRPAAGKTGSTNDYGAAWFAGYTPQYATAVWVGDPRGPQYGMTNGVSAYGGTQFYAPVYGGTIPALIWKDTMLSIHKGLPIKQFTEPGGETALGMVLKIPNVKGMTPEAAFTALKESGFNPILVRGETEPIVGLPSGTITKTVPSAGTKVSTLGRDVTVYVPIEPPVSE